MNFSVDLDDLEELTTLLDKDDECIRNSNLSKKYSDSPRNIGKEGHCKNNQPVGYDLGDLSTLLNEEELIDHAEPPTHKPNKSSLVDKGESCKDKKTLRLVKKNEFKLKDDSANQSEIHTGDTDSSDDEDNKYAANPLYSEMGRSIKNALKKTDSHTRLSFDSPSWKTKKTPVAASPSVKPTSTKTEKLMSKDILADPIFGIRVTTPLISSESMKEKMAGKIAVRFNRLENHLVTGDKGSDWVFAGVIISKITRKSQKGNPYACWVMSDLREDLKTVTVFLFGKAYKDLWKTNTHTVVAILNATPLENRQSSKDIATVSVMNPDQVLVWGQSKDLGVCKARKKNGEPCTAFVNKNQCEFCIYHVKQEYQKFRGRSELQAPSGGGLSQLRNKVLGKNEVFYAGKSFTAVQAKPNKKQVAKDQMRLTQLFNQCESRLPATHRPAASGDTMRQKLMRDAERLQSLVGTAVTPGALSNKALQEEMISLASGAGKNKVTSSKKELPEKKHDINKSLTDQTSSLSKLNTYQTKCEASKQKKNVLASHYNVSKLDKHRLPMNKQTESSKVARTANTSSNQTGSSGQKKGPMKTRFDNLVKLKSCQDKIKESEVVSCASKQLKPIDMFDVCFDFDNDTDNGCKPRSKTDESKNTSDGPLRERKSPTKHDTMLNISSGLNHKAKSPKSLQGAKRDILKENDSTGPELSVNCLHQFKNPLPKANSNLNCKDMANVGAKLSKNSETSPNSSIQLKSPTLDRFFKSPDLKDQRNDNGDKHQPSDHRSPDNLARKSPKELSQLKLTNGRPLTSPGHRQSRAKAQALKYIQHKGPIDKENPGKKKKKCEFLDQENKRKRSEEDEETEKPRLSQRFLELMNITSKHGDLLAQAEDSAMDNYFDRLEIKEKMEEKMLTTYSVECKAVRCLQCKYKWFTASDLCRAQNHPIKVISAVKRFFQCHKCRNRTISLEVIPLHNCSNCGSGNWQRAPMMRERKSATVHLSIRGGEQRFVNSVESNTNLDLLVPDDS